MDQIQRYTFCEKFPTIPPFDAVSYDNVPAFWADFCNIMASEVAKCTKEKMKDK
jgi:hypothetical protein